jgi:uncharacterized protein (TIGR02271 family)
MVVTHDHAQGTIVESLERDAVVGDQYRVRFDNGQEFVIPSSALRYNEADSNYSLDVTLDELLRGTTRPQTPTTADEIIIPLEAEQLEVGKEEIVTGVVRVHKVVHEREEVVSQSLNREDVTVERVTVNRLIDAPQDIRYEGDVMIVPLVEEVLVVEKRLMLREELHIRKRQSSEQHTEAVVLRSENATIEHLPPP